jgi:transcriptional regulator of acetoin/glycerol metabolism
MSRNESNQVSGLTKRVYDFAELVLKNRFAKALDNGAARIHSEALISTPTGCSSPRTAAARRTIAPAPSISGPRTWRAPKRPKQRILAKAGSTRITEPMFSIDWNFLTSRGELESACIEEMANDLLYDRAYPEIKGGVRNFIRSYLEARETVLVLQGPPGTGKTRLIRAILGEMSRRKGEQAKALYTGDMKALASDELFVKFITGHEEAFIVEDADHLLKPRADGNEHLHRFLTIADGVVRSQGRKIIFSTNLPNVGDLDAALIRPGRCFAHIHVRTLTGDIRTT